MKPIITGTRASTRASTIRRAAGIIGALAVCALAATVGAHGNTTPQAVDTSMLPQLGTEWRTENPYRKNELAIRVGSAAYNQNCARCHGLDAVSGGMAPDLRKLDNDCAALPDPRRKEACAQEIDQYVLDAMRRGRVRNGAVYMPPFQGVFTQEAMWAIKAYLETVREQQL